MPWVPAGIIGGAIIGGVASSSAADTSAEASLDSAEIQARAGREAISGQEDAAQRAQGFFEPFAGVAEQGVEGADFLANPQAQFDFLQNNPLFELSLENANQRTLQTASANRRLSFGDTLQNLSNNVLLASTPLIDRQRQDITNLLRFGGDIATSQANIETGQAARIGDVTTSIGAANAAGTIGAANAANAGTAGVAQALQTGLLAFGNRSNGSPPPPTSGRIAVPQQTGRPAAPLF